ncbi:aldo/keto reductase [Micromonospora sp. NPDC049559]|uniref:aldo/keto reductase n=1 Tax=Micromonospora sp. NPDC049559 TaxID=3155923 RepID=UPI0034210B04
MRYQRLGASGLMVSRIGLGMMSFGDPAVLAWSLPEEAAEPIVRRAVEAGVTFFDTADMYSDGASERLTGRLLGRFFARRDDYVLATKVYYPTGDGPNGRGLSRKHIMAAVDASLRRLGTDHIDLYQIHRWDHGTPVEETMSALDDLVRGGKVRYLGASLMRAWQFAKAQHTAQLGGWTRFVSMQTRYNLVYREEEREMIPICGDQGVGVLPYSPLARGLLARSPGAPGGTTRSRAEGDRSRTGDGDAEIVDALRAVAATRDVPPARVALAWLLGKPAVSAPIIGATRADQLDDVLRAVDLELTAAETAAIEAPYRPHEPYGYS